MPHVIQIFVDFKFCERATYVSFNHLLTPNFVNVPCVNIMNVLGVTKPLVFNLHSYNLVKIIIRFLANSCPISE